MVGELNDGWRVAMTTLTYERGISSLATQVRMKQHLDAMMEYARGPAEMVIPCKDPVTGSISRRPTFASRSCC